jgi:hypothetical protein
MDQEIPAPARGTGRRQQFAAYSRRPAVLVAAAIVLLLAIALLVWLLLRGGGEEASEQSRAPANAASIQRLNAFASSIAHPIYWVGSQPRFTYELSRTKDGRVYIRYLPPGAKVGSSNPNYLTVGTYPQRHAFATLRATAKKQGVSIYRLPAGGLAFQYKGRPTSVYLAYPRSQYQIEVFDPAPARALRLVTSGQVKPVGAPPRSPTGSRAATVQQLEALAVSLGHPIYWAGARPGDTYELTRTKGGSVYVRYLPQGVKVGDRRPSYLTIGSYPQKEALATLKATAAKNGTATIAVAGGGLALVDEKHPTSAYVAYAGVDVQVEVYAARPGRARQLVTSGRIEPIG